MNLQASPPQARVSIEAGPSVPRVRHPLRYAVGVAILRLTGWRVRVKLPDEPKMIIIVAPHTSNWDFVFGIAAIFALHLPIHWFAKHTLFQGLPGRFFRRLGGLPVDRSAPPAAWSRRPPTCSAIMSSCCWRSRRRARVHGSRAGSVASTTSRWRHRCRSPSAISTSVVALPASIPCSGPRATGIATWPRCWPSTAASPPAGRRISRWTVTTGASAEADPPPC